VSDELAVVRRPYIPGLKPIRTGVVIAQEGDLYDVRWDDNGAEDEIRLGDYERVMPRDSLSYLASLGGLNAEFAADPLAVVLRVLGEHDDPVNAKVIRAYLIDLGLDKTVWSSTWAKLQKVLVVQDEVVCAGEGTARTFSWTGGKLPDPAWAVAPTPEPVAATPQPEPAAPEEPAVADEEPAADEEAPVTESSMSGQS
jgi:hypothetical protein